ncbi:MAG: glycosyltransferase family 2 protein [Candidatus Thermoplasmatota archaeon]|nr:glycosyltransferase family 2 protein [Candidatus Thermoplasmatota archaeon]
MSIKSPKISFIIPVLNEEKIINKCLKSLLKQDYSKEKIEILIALGKSSDKTNEVVEEYSKKNSNIKIFPNLSGNTAIGRNICIKHSTGEMIMNYSGHAIAEKNLLKVLALKLQKSPPNIAAVGCSNVNPQNSNFIAAVSGVAFSSFLGGKNLFVQNAEFDSERFVDHISFACYRKKYVEEVGNFDPDFWCGQDAELDLRLLKAGYKILYTPDTKVYHYKRNTLGSLFKQMYRYGIARAKMVKKHPGTLRFFHLIGSCFVIGGGLLIILTILKVIPLWFPLLLLLLYFIASIVSSCKVTKKPIFILSSILFYFLIHIGYGIGFIRGFFPGKL